MIAITESVITKVAITSDPTGNIGKLNLKNPYPPILSNIAAKTTDPAVGACTCASGNQV